MRPHRRRRRSARLARMRRWVTDAGAVTFESIIRFVDELFT
ncbi:hypothetical protein [Micromonospora arborensis]